MYTRYILYIVYILCIYQVYVIYIPGTYMYVHIDVCTGFRTYREAMDKRLFVRKSMTRLEK